MFRCDESQLQQEYLSQFVRTSMWSHHLARVGSGGVRVRIWYDDLARMVVPLPPVEEQAAIAQLLNAVEREVELLEQFRNALARECRSVAELLLTGKVRVPE